MTNGLFRMQGIGRHVSFCSDATVGGDPVRGDAGVIPLSAAGVAWAIPDYSTVQSVTESRSLMKIRLPDATG